MTDKKQLREHFRQLRTAAVHDREQLVRDEMIADRFTKSEAYLSCEKLLIYISGEIEVDTTSIIEDAFSKGKTVLVPRCVKGTNIMEFYRINSFDDLDTGSYGILEPDKKCEKYDGFDNSVCVVPGLSFDLRGYRLGFGKGFYDRFLTEHDIPAIGLCYENCISETLPAESHDVSVDCIVTQDRVILARKDDT